jgi:hypothetical protein
MRDPKADAQAYAWNWFALHSAQRLQLVNFWLVAVAFLAAAFVQARSNHLYAIALGVSVTGVIASLAFMRLDARTRQLVCISEEALRYLEEDRMADGLDDVTALVKASEMARHTRFDSYRILIQGLQLTVAVLFSAAAVYSLVT